jgi:hypothetical protein
MKAMKLIAGIIVAWCVGVAALIPTPSTSTPIQQMLLAGGGVSFTATPTLVVPLTAGLIPTTAAGSSTPTFTRGSNTGTPTFHDYEGFVRSAATNQARIVGARVVSNLATFSEAMTNAAWVKTSTTATATTLTATGANATTLQTANACTTCAWVMRVRMSRITGTGNIQLTLDNGSTWTTVTLTGSPQVFSISKAAGAAAVVGVRIVTSGDAINADRWQVELVPNGSSNTNPDEYVSCGVLSSPWNGAGVDCVQYFNTFNGNTVSSNVVTEATGSAINTANGGNVGSVDAVGPLGYLAEKSLSNVLLRSEQFDNASWTKGNITVTADAVVAPDGQTTADKLAESDTVNHAHYAYQDVTGSNGLYSAMSVYAKAAERTWAFVVAEPSTASTDVGAYFNLTTCAVGTVQSGYTARATPAANGFCRLMVAYQQAAGGSTRMLVAPATADGTWIYPGTTGSGIYVWGAHGEVNNYHSGISSYLATTSGQVARSADDLTYSFASNADQTVGTAYAELKTLWTTKISGSASESPAVAIAFNAVTYGPLYSTSEAATIIRIKDSTNDLSKTGLTDMSTAVRKRASSWKSSNSTLLITGDGAAPSSGTFDGTMLQLSIGIGKGSGGAVSGWWYGTLRNVKLWTTAATSAELQSLTQ